jgi:ATP/maltotriose-dependent transcriptional regulator MalT
MGDYGEAERLGLRTIERGRRYGFPLSVALSAQGMLMLLQGRDDDAEPWLRQSLDESHREGDEGQRAYVLRALSRVLGGRGAVGEAVRLCEESLALVRRLKETRGIGYSLVLLADLLDRSQRLDEALARSEQAMAVFERAHMPVSVAQARQQRGSVLMRLGDLAHAGRELATAMDVLHLHGWAEWYVAASHLAWVELLEGRTESADRLLARADEQARRCGSSGVMVVHLGRLVVAARRERWGEWDRVYDTVLDQIGRMPADPRYLWLVGRALECVGDDPDRAYAVGAVARRMEERLAGRLPA